MKSPILQKEFHIKGGDFIHAGEASSGVKQMLKDIGIDPKIIKKAAIAAYEAEMNLVCYAYKGVMKVTLTPEFLKMEVEDEGPGIEDIELAMKEGYSTADDKIREMGFGAGMGLPNIKKNVDEFKIESEVGKGTKLDLTLYLKDGFVR